MRSRLSRFKYLAPRLGLALGSVYLTLLAVEVGLRLQAKPQGAIPHGLLQADKAAGFALVPGYHGQFDDGFVRGDIHINSLGYRDDEPHPDAISRVLLLGDSFTFGYLLDQTETIDKWVERLEPGLEVCNLGVSAYNLPQQLEPLRRWTLPAQQVVYLFFCNDLLTNSMDHYNVVEGYLVPRSRPDGTLYSENELQQEIARKTQPNDLERLSPRTMLLAQVRQIVQRAAARLDRISDRDRDWLEDVKVKTKLRNLVIPCAVDYTLQMRALAVERAMNFLIVIIPALDEVRAAKYRHATAQYVAGLRAAGFDVIELLPRLSTADYWRHDVHFNPQGAKKAAEAISQALKQSRETSPIRKGE